VRGNLPASRQVMIHPLDLGEPDGCSEVHHAVVVADHIEPIALVRTDPLPTVESDLVGENVIISRDHSSFTGSYDLIAVKGKGRASSQPADARAAIFRAMCLGGILDNEKLMALGDPANLIHLGGMAV